MGFSPDCYAIEINEEFVANIENKNYNIIVSKDFCLTIDQEYNSNYKLLLMSHVLEHFKHIKWKYFYL